MKELEIPDCERSADVIDQASMTEQLANKESVEKVLANIEKAPKDFDGVTCIDCGNEIPEARLKTGAFRDLYCQEAHELRHKNHRSHYE